MGRVLMIAAVAAAMLLALPAVAGAQEYPPPPTITVDNPAVTVVIEGDDWEPGTEVTITRNDSTQSASAQSTEVITVATVDSTGSFTADVSVPEGAELQLQAAGVGSSGEERVDDYVVTASPEGATASQLPASGFPVWQGLAGVALALIVLGGASVTVARRRVKA